MLRTYVPDPLQIVAADGNPLPGFTFADCQAVVGDGLALPLRWQRPLSELSGRPVRIEVRLLRARLFAFELVP